jgi:protein O-GlcNAc transferase
VALIDQAIDHHRAGRLPEAARLYRRVLEREPEHTDALYLLGLVAHQTGDHTEAIELIRKSLELVPDQPQALNVLGLAQAACGRTEDAEASYRKAIALERAPEFYNNLGNLRKDAGRLDEAIFAYNRAVGIDPEYAAAHYNLGNAHRTRQDLEEAERSFRRAIAADAAHGNALAALGQVLLARGQANDALPFLERAVARLPGDAALWCDVGDALQALGRWREAVARYQSALRCDPPLARAWFAAGCAEAAQHEYADAAFCLRKALEAAPGWPEAHHNLGQALYNLGQVDHALAEFRAAEQGPAPEMPRAMIAVIIPGSAAAAQQDILEARRSFAAHLPPRRDPASSPGDRPRIGYLSSFFHRHNWMKPVWGLINQHDRARFEIHLFSDAPALGTGYAVHREDTFHDISALDNEEAADRIHAAGIDLLIDLNGYSKVQRLPLVALHPARVIAGWFNMYATSGMPAYDFLIGDEQVVTRDDEAHYSETVLRVPGSYLTFAVDYPVPPVAEAPCVRDGAITFGSLASQYKITSEVAAVWARILLAVRGSTLILRNSALGSSGNRDFVTAMFAGQGVADRLRLMGPADHDEFLRTYDAIDIALDTFPYNGGTTTTEALWQGVPVVTIDGDRWAARTSASILRAGGQGHLVARDVDEYVALALRLASTPRDLAELRQGMRPRLLHSPVCDTRAFARNMEDLYVRMLSR